MAPTGKSSSSTEARFRTLSGRGLSEDEVELGRIVGVFGVRGEVRVHLHNREGSVLLDDPWDVILVPPHHSAVVPLGCGQADPGSPRRAVRS